MGSVINQNCCKGFHFKENVEKHCFTVSQAHEVHAFICQSPTFSSTGHDTTFQFHLVLVLFVSLHQKYGIPYLLTFCSLKHSLHLDVI